MSAAGHTDVLVERAQAVSEGTGSADPDVDAILAAHDKAMKRRNTADACADEARRALVAWRELCTTSDPEAREETGQHLERELLNAIYNADRLHSDAMDADMHLRNTLIERGVEAPAHARNNEL